MPPVSFTLANFMGGALEERFAGELARVLDNIRDPNTPALGKREIIVKFTLDPEDSREVGDIECTVSSKPQGTKRLASRMFIGKDRDGNPVLTTENPKQANLFPSEVASFNREGNIGSSVKP